jgi:hypothetical protein
VRVGATSAHILSPNPFETSTNDPGKPIHWVPDVTFEIGRQTDGSREWHGLYGLPAYGAGFSVARYRSDIAHGRPLEAYTFFSWPFVRLNDKLALTTDFDMGLSWNWRQFDQKTQSSNSVLSSDVNVRIDWGFYLRYSTTARTSVFSGIDFTHRSNGGVVQPDRGINVIGPKVAMQYSLKRGSSSHPVTPSPQPFRPAWEFVVGGVGGVKNVMEKSSPALRQDFGVFNITSGLQRHFYRFGKVAAGTDLTYDGATGAKGDLNDGAPTQWRVDAGQRWALGLYGGYEHLIGRFSPIVQIGYNVARALGSGDYSSPRLYQRFGWRVQLNDRFWGTVALRATHVRKADSIAFGVGYRFRWLPEDRE